MTVLRHRPFYGLELDIVFTDNLSRMQSKHFIDSGSFFSLSLPGCGKLWTIMYMSKHLQWCTKVSKLIYLSIYEVDTEITIEWQEYIMLECSFRPHTLIIVFNHETDFHFSVLTYYLILYKTYPWYYSILPYLTTIFLSYIYKQMCIYIYIRIKYSRIITAEFMRQHQEKW